MIALASLSVPIPDGAADGTVRQRGSSCSVTLLSTVLGVDVRHEDLCQTPFMHLRDLLHALSWTSTEALSLLLPVGPGEPRDAAP